MNQQSPDVRERPISSSSPKGVGKEEGFPQPPAGYPPPPFNPHGPPPMVPVVAYVAEPTPDTSCLDACLAALCCCCLLDLCLPFPYF